jgi:7-keto-8-aminopelargonate synthetase-like enzyme
VSWAKEEEEQQNFFGLEKEVDIIMSTFSKSLASLGGFIAADEDVIHYVKHVSRPFIFSASIPPANLGAAMEALNIIESEPERIKRLWENAEFMKKGFISLGLSVGNSQTPVVPVMTYEDYTTFKIARELLDEGVYVNPVISPGVRPVMHYSEQAIPLLIQVNNLSTHLQPLKRYSANTTLIN